MSAKKPTTSFEFFPPKTPNGRDLLMGEVAKLAEAKPDFMTVTYGAGGSTRDWTKETAIAIQTMTGIPTACHLTCVNTFKHGILNIADELWQAGIRHIVALRGDIPHQDMPLDYNNRDYYHFANELVHALKERYSFEISVAAYPEKHPEAPDLATDIEHLKRKCDSGADRAITQFFFDNRIYFDFVEAAEQAGIRVPIVPGVLPISNFEKMLSFAATCQTKVPIWLHEKFRPHIGDQKAMDEIAQEVLTAQVQDLVKQGVPHVHYYTLNKADLTLAACAACETGGGALPLAADRAN